MSCPVASSSGSDARAFGEPADDPAGRRAHREHRPATSIGIMKVLDRINRTGTTLMATHDAAIVDPATRLELGTESCAPTSLAEV